MSPERQRRLWQQIHSEEFPNGRLKVYGEGVSWDERCRNGCVDYGAITLYHFARVGNQDAYRPVHLNLFGFSGADDGRGPSSPVTSDRGTAIGNGKWAIDRYWDSVCQAPPAPDGSQPSISR